MSCPHCGKEGRVSDNPEQAIARESSGGKGSDA